MNTVLSFIILLGFLFKRIQSSRSYNYLSTLGAITSDLNKHELTLNDDDTFMRLYENLEQKVDAENYPIFEFQKEFDNLRKLSGDLLSLSLENLLAKYLNGLRTYYFNEFCRRFEQQSLPPLSTIFNPKKLKEKIIREFQVAMLKSIPIEVLSDSLHEVQCLFGHFYLCNHYKRTTLKS